MKVLVNHLSYNKVGYKQYHVVAMASKLLNMQIPENWNYETIFIRRNGFNDQ